MSLITVERASSQSSGLRSSQGNRWGRKGAWVSRRECRLVTNRVDPTLMMVRITEAEVGEPSRERSRPQTEKSALNRLPARNEELDSVSRCRR
jgi:hypothetical protein